MMRTLSRSIKALFAAVAALAMCLTFSASTASASPTPPASSATWDLSDGEQRYCAIADRPQRYYILAFVSGSWDAPLAFELQGMPEGSVVTSYPSYPLQSGDPIPPGDNGSDYQATYWFIAVLPPLEYGEHHATLHATDGTVSETTPLVFVAGDNYWC